MKALLPLLPLLAHWWQRLDATQLARWEVAAQIALTELEQDRATAWMQLYRVVAGA